MYLSNKIAKNKTKEATLTYSTFDVVPVHKILYPNSIVSFIYMTCHLDWIQNTIGTILIPQTIWINYGLRFLKKLL